MVHQIYYYYYKYYYLVVTATNAAIGWFGPKVFFNSSIYNLVCYYDNTVVLLYSANTAYYNLAIISFNPSIDLKLFVVLY